MASGGDDTYVLGNNIQLLDANEVIGELFTGWTLRGRTLPPFSESAVFAYPKAVGINGDIHVIYGEPQSKPVDIKTWIALQVSSLWWVTYSMRNGWSKPARIYEGMVVWDRSSTEVTVSRGVSESLHFFAPSGGPAILHGWLNGQRWLTRVVPATLIPTYISAAAVGRKIVVAFAGPTFEGSRIVNSVFAMSSNDEGYSWSTPVRLANSSASSIKFLKVLRDRHDFIHVVWAEIVSSDEQPTLRHILTTASLVIHRGASEGVLVLQPGVLAELQVAIDRCNRVRAIYSVLESGGWSLNEALWDGGWLSPRDLFSALDVTDITLESTTDDDVIVVFLGRPAKSPRTVPFASMYSRLRTH